MKKNYYVDKHSLLKMTAFILTAVIMFLMLPQAYALENTSYREIEFDLRELRKYPQPMLKMTGGSFRQSYYDQLDETERLAYDCRAKNVESIKDGDIEEIGFDVNTGVNVDEFTAACLNAISAYDMDHPELFWMNMTVRLGIQYNTATNIVISGRFVKPTTGWYIQDYKSYDEIASAQKAFDDRVNELVNTAKGTKFDRLLYFHDWLVNNNSYNAYVYNGNTDIVTDIAWSAASALIGDPQSDLDDPVCEGYARAFKVLCDRQNIPCILIPGYSNNVAHIWNYVKMDNGLWFAIDVTWDDPIAPEPMLLYDHFLKGSKKFMSDHDEDNVFRGKGVASFPILSERDYPFDLGGDLGDVNDNGMIDSADVSLILRSIVGIEIASDRIPYTDFNCNGITDAGDASGILRFIVGNV